MSVNRPRHLRRRASIISPPRPAERLSAHMVVVNRWEGVAGDQECVVQAGYLRADPSSGVLVLLRYPDDADRRSGRYILAPKQSGPLRIVGSVGSTLTVQSGSGQRFMFSIPSAKLSNLSSHPVSA